MDAPIRRLLVADLHFDDNPANEYRWNIFTDIIKAVPTEVYILGDLCHKKDRHSAALVNRLISQLCELAVRGITVTILCGNHDEPLRGPPYWSFLSGIPGLNFITTPSRFPDGLLVLPHSVDPTTEWAHIDFNKYKCILMHQPVSGADLGNGMIIDEGAVLVFPDIPLYSGDLHYPQVVHGIEYLGTPYPINFGEHHTYRMLVLDRHWNQIEEIILHPVAKHKITVHSLEELQQWTVQAGDQAKVEFVLPASRVDQWPVEQAAIAEWAQEHGVTLSVVTAAIETSPSGMEESGTGYALPIDVLVAFSEVEGIEEALLMTGYNLLQEALGEGQDE